MNQQEKDSLNLVASRLGIDPQWLYNVIQFESKWNPQAIAKVPYNKSRLDAGLDQVPKYAKGLIQFIDKTAQGLGFADSLDLITKYPDIVSQLQNPVYNYLKQYYPFGTEQDFYMSIFYPAYRFVEPTTEFKDSIKVANPGINTVNDYVKKIQNAGKGFISKMDDLSKNPLLILLIVAIAAIIIYKLSTI